MSPTWKALIDGGEPVRLGENMGWPAVSPDGKLVACALQVPLPARLGVLPVEGGEPVKVFDVRPNMPSRIGWTGDGRGVTYVSRQNGVDEIWSQPIDGGEPEKLTNFKADRIFAYDWSHDNRLVISHGSETSDVVLIRNVNR